MAGRIRLVTNALKYAYPAGTRGEIRVELQKVVNEIKLGVSVTFGI